MSSFLAAKGCGEHARKGAHHCLPLQQPSQKFRAVITGAIAMCRKRSVTQLHLGVGLEHDPEKWKPVFRKDHAPSKC
jgi:hypothetical protein